MPLLVTCPCGQPLRVRQEDLGGLVRCPSCRAALALPSPVKPGPLARPTQGTTGAQLTPPPPPSCYWLLRGTAPAGPFDLQAVAALLAAGEASSATPCCRVGDSAWRPLQEHTELAALLPPTPQPPPPKAPAPPATPGVPDAAARAPELWSPGAAVGWSLLLTPAFGMILHAANWDALGRPKRARANMVWAWVTFAFIAACLLSVLLNDNGPGACFLSFIGVAILLLWYVSEARGQSAYVKAHHHGGYVSRPWTAPLLIGSGAAVAYVVVCVALASLVQRPADPAKLAEALKPLILKEWEKKPALRGARIERIVLVHKGGKTYVGFLEAALGLRTARLELEVTVDGDNFYWVAKPFD